MSTQSGLWPAQKIAKLLGISVRELSTLAQTGKLPKDGNGYPVVATVQAYIEHLRSTLPPSSQCTTRELSQHVGLTEQRINQYVVHGMPKLDRNAFDLHVCCRWIREYEQRLLNQRIAESQGAQERYYDEQAKRTAINAERDYDKLMQARGELIHISTLTPALNRAWGSLKAKTIGLENSLIRVIGIDHARIVGTEIRKLLAELAGDIDRLPGVRGSGQTLEPLHAGLPDSTATHGDIRVGGGAKGSKSGNKPRRIRKVEK